MIDVEAARRWLRDVLPAREQVELTDPAVLEAAAEVVLVSDVKGAKP